MILIHALTVLSPIIGLILVVWAVLHLHHRYSCRSINARASVDRTEKARSRERKRQIKREWNAIMRKIHDGVNRGSNYICLLHRPEEENEKRLVSMGYTVDARLVSWNKPEEPLTKT